MILKVGLNDANYKVTWKENDVKVFCPFYLKWKDMLQRCYSESYHKRQPSYIGCSVCEDWLTFSKFKSWMETQDWEGKQLDKDLLVKGNKIYSPETCVFLSQELNSFLTDSKSSRGEWPLGVSYCNNSKKFVSHCRNNKLLKLGYFNTPEEAHKAWLSKKIELAYTYASEQKDARVAKALMSRYNSV